VGYFFGRELHRSLGVPIGLINTSWGGTPAESWTSLDTLTGNADLKPIVDRWNHALAEFPKANEQYQKEFADWKEAAEKAKAEGKTAPPAPRPPLGPDHPHRAAGLFNGMIVPLVPFAIRGAIWYQGESNAGRAYQYRTLLPAMIQDWREAWGQGEFPFLIVQLANFEARPPQPEGSDWAELREAQTMTLALPKTGMAVTIDIGEAKDIHPRNKQDVGRRLALAAQRIAYGNHLVYSGPVYDSMKIEGSKIRIRFQHVGGGLMAKGDAPLGFTIAGEERNFVPAHATIDGDTVVVWSDQVSDPVAVRYGWADNPVCNLYNNAELPASPFRTDDWPGLTKERR
jgi:sialate O-acetylesterase